MIKIKKEEAMSSEKKNNKIKLSFKIINPILFSIIIICGAYYLVSTNNLSIKGLELQKLKTKINQLSSENDDLELRIMALKSYNNLSQRVEELNMVAVGEIEYIASAVEVVKH